MYLKETSDAQRRFDREYPALLLELLKIADKMNFLEMNLLDCFVQESGQATPFSAGNMAKIRGLVEEWREREAYRSREEAKASTDPATPSGGA
jgi:hypothetical protein